MSATASSAADDNGAKVAATLLELLGEERAQLPRRGSHQSFRATRSGRCWLVVSGALDLFLSSASATEPGHSGPRDYLATLTPGCLCYGNDQRALLLAVPRQGTQLLELDAEHLQRLFAAAAPVDISAAAAQALVMAAELSVRAFAATPRLPAPPVALRVLTEPAQIQLADGETLQAAQRQLFWLETDSTALWLCNVEDSQSGKPAPLPTSRGLWYQAHAEQRVTAQTTANLLAAGGLNEALGQFQNRLLSAASADLKQLEDRDSEQLDQAERAADQQVESALWSLAAILGTRRRRVPTPSPEPLINALWLITDFYGIARPSEDGLDPALNSDDPVLALAQRAGMFVRAVELTDAWWKDAQEPLLARQLDDQRPCLLLPGRRRRYRCIDPATGTSQVVDAKLAATLDSSARTFYRPFPNEPLSASRILFFGLKGSGRDAVVVVLLILLSGLLSLALPTLSERIFDPIVPLAELGQLLVVCLAILVAGLAQQGFGLLQGLTLLRVEGRVTMSVQAAVWDRLLKLPAGFFQDYSAGDLANRAMSVDAMRRLLSSAALAGISHGVIASFSLGLLLYYDWRVTLLVLVSVLLYSGIALYAGRRVMKKNRVILKREGQLQGVVLRLLDGLTKLRVAGAERTAFARWGRLYAALQQTSFRQQGLENTLTVFKSGFSHFALVAVIVAISLQGEELLAFYQTPQDWAQLDNQRLQEIMPTGRFVAYHVALAQFLGGIFGLISLLVRLSLLPAYYERVEPILKTATENEAGAADPGEVEGRIDIENVFFRYAPDAPLILNGVSLRADPHEMIAIVGPSGAGKSSLIRLILGFEKPEGGSIYLDGKDISNLDKHAMRRRFGVVMQNGRLLAGSVHQNIAGGAQLSREQVMEAVRLAGFDRDLAEMPMGLDTHLSEGASTLSGGQRQRLMIARAVVHRPRVLIFDEATSALDNRSQKVVTEGLERLNSTRILIAHRLSTIVHADRIYVIDQGAVVETGTYETLLAGDGLFAKLARRQML